MRALVLVIDLYSLLICAAAFVSWTDAPLGHPIARGVRGATQFVLAPVRRLVPSVRGWDLAPLLVFLALRALRAFLERL